MAHENLLNYFSQQVNLYLDNRLNEESSQHLLNTVNQDPECQNVFNKEKNFRDFIKNNAKRTSASEELINIIKDKLG
jgi:hypothetical protein